MSDEFFDTNFFCGGIGFRRRKGGYQIRSEDCMYIGDQVKATVPLMTFPPVKGGFSSQRMNYSLALAQHLLKFSKSEFMK